jgi:hypothetical protein
MQSLFDIERWQHLMKIGYTDAEATDIVWDEALAGQLKGNYTVGHVHYACQQCAYGIIEAAVGDNAAKLAMLPMMLLGELASVVIGAELASRDDDGLTFASIVRGGATTIAELLTHLDGEAISVNVAAAGGAK